MTDRSFICDVEPQGDGGWEIWISEEPYRGMDTDSALGDWERIRTGGSWTSRRLVGRRMTRVLAQRLARAAVRRAEMRAIENDRGHAIWRANRERQPFRVTSQPAETDQPEEGNDE